jgi:hypothetical protein
MYQLNKRFKFDDRMICLKLYHHGTSNGPVKSAFDRLTRQTSNL